MKNYSDSQTGWKCLIKQSIRVSLLHHITQHFWYYMKYLAPAHLPGSGCLGTQVCSYTSRSGRCIRANSPEHSRSRVNIQCRTSIWDMLHPAGDTTHSFISQYFPLPAPYIPPFHFLFLPTIYLCLTHSEFCWQPLISIQISIQIRIQISIQ